MISSQSASGTAIQRLELERLKLAQLSTDAGVVERPDENFSQLLSKPGLADLGVMPERSESNWEGCSIGVNGRYRVIRRIGQGGMAKVYLGTDSNRHDAPVAIKVPLEKLICRRGVRERLGREFRALIDLEHPHICRVIDAGLHDDVPFMVMPYLSGGNLTERYFRLRVNEEPRTIDGLFAWLRPVATAIDFMHRRHYIHRDIKPQNILFDADGNPYVGDLGIVRAIGDGTDRDSNPGLTTLNAWLGTPGYIAPEVGTTRDVDGRADLFSLAAMTYLFLTDAAPFSGGTPLEIRDAQQKRPPTAANQLNALLSEGAAGVLAKGMSVRPEDRQASCLAFVDEFEVACGRATVAEPPVITTRRRRKFGWSAVAILGLVGAALLSLPGFTPFRAGGGLADVSVHYRNARQYLANGEPEAALEILNAAIKHSPDDASLYALRADSLRLLDRPQPAIEQYSEAIKRDPQAEYLFQRGQVSLTLADGASAARTDFTAALRKQPRADISGYRGLAAFMLSDFPAAIEDYSAAIDAGGSEASSDELASWHNGRGLAHLRSDNAKSALADFDEALRHQPSSSTILQNRAAANARLGGRN